MRRRKQQDIFGILLLPAVSLSIPMLRNPRLNEIDCPFLSWSAGKRIPIPKLIEKLIANLRVV